VTLSVRSDRKLIQATERSERFVLAEITAPAARREGGRPPVNLAFVLDRSGSMGGDKIRLARLAVEESIARLHETDRFSIVAYDDHIDVVVPGTLATAEARRTALARLREIDARGSTNLGEGWLRGAEQVAETLSAEGVNRALLLTDGLANVGITDRDELARHAGELRKRGVSTTTFGVGDDFDEALLQAMAAPGGGHFYYIAAAESIADHVTSEVGEALEVVARDVTLSISVHEGVGVEVLSPFPATSRSGRTEIVLGDLTAEEQRQLVVRLDFPYGQIGHEAVAVFALADRDEVLSSSSERLAWDYADTKANDAQERDAAVDRAVAQVLAARARQEAIGINRIGNFAASRRLMEGVITHLRAIGSRDMEVRTIVDQLHLDADGMAAPMMEVDRKELYARESYVMASRSSEGKARKAKPAPAPRPKP
jgi:Ca-activated chloride channel family protein